MGLGLATSRGMSIGQKLVQLNWPLVFLLCIIAAIGVGMLYSAGNGSWEPWAVREASRHDWRMLLEAGRAIGAFSSREWLGTVDVPTAVVMTMRDSVVPLRRQTQLFEMIPDARAFRVDADHDAVVAHEQFNPTLLRAVRSVLERQ